MEVEEKRREDKKREGDRGREAKNILKKCVINKTDKDE